MIQVANVPTSNGTVHSDFIISRHLQDTGAVKCPSAKVCSRCFNPHGASNAEKRTLKRMHRLIKREGVLV